MADETVTIKVKADTKQAQTNLKELGEKIANLGMRISAAFTLPIVGAFAMAVSKSEELQKALKPIQDAFSGVAVQLAQALIPLVQELTPSLIQLANALAEVVRWYTELSPSTQKTIAGFIALLAAVGPVIAVVGQLVGTIGTVQAIMGGLGISLGAASTGFTAFGASAVAALTPLLPLLIAIAGLIALVNTEFGKRGITAGKQLLAGTAAIGAGLVGGREAAASTFKSASESLGLIETPGAPARASGGQTVIYNNYGVDVSNPYVKKALEPYINGQLRGNGQR